jgi:transcriptional/translational regulatory protein YebC/TACO1
LGVEGGADDVNQDDDAIEMIAPIENFKILSDKLRQAGIAPEEAELRMLPNQEVELNVEDTLQVMRTIENLEDLDDVQNVYSNLKLSEEAMASLEAD